MTTNVECKNCHQDHMESRLEDDNYECPACGRTETPEGKVVEKGNQDMAYNPKEASEA